MEDIQKDVYSQKSHDVLLQKNENAKNLIIIDGILTVLEC